MNNKAILQLVNYGVLLCCSFIVLTHMLHYPFFFYTSFFSVIIRSLIFTFSLCLSRQ